MQNTDSNSIKGCSFIQVLESVTFYPADPGAFEQDPPESVKNQSKKSMNNSYGNRITELWRYGAKTQRRE